MKERPILFSGAMVRALLAGTKTQTRRICKPAANLSSVVEVPDPLERGQVYNGSHFGDEDGEVQFACPYGGRGDRLWVRETWMDLQGTGIEIVTGSRERYAYGADTPRGSYGDDQRKCYGLKWRPSIHMPRSASRITLEITSVRVERLRDISDADARVEGCTQNHNGYYRGGPHKAGGLKQMATAKQAYQDLWKSINGPGSWDVNPWVWVVEFRRLP